MKTILCMVTTYIVVTLVDPSFTVSDTLTTLANALN